jgi:hypothetical protein
VSTLALILVPAALFAAVVWLVLTIREGGSGGLPWGAVPAWVVVAVALVVLGAVVAPRLFGFTLLFLPLLWMGRGRRRGGPPPRK